MTPDQIRLSQIEDKLQVTEDWEEEEFTDFSDELVQCKHCAEFTEAELKTVTRVKVPLSLNEIKFILSKAKLAILLERLIDKHISSTDFGNSPEPRA